MPGAGGGGTSPAVPEAPTIPYDRDGVLLAEGGFPGVGPVPFVLSGLDPFDVEPFEFELAGAEPYGA